MNQLLHTNKTRVTFPLRMMWLIIGISSFLLCGGLYAGVGFGDVFLVKNDSDQIVQMNIKQGEAELQVWFDKKESRRIACRLFSDEDINPVEFLAGFPNWKDGKLVTSLKQDTNIDTQNDSTDEGNVYCVLVTPTGEIKDNPDCNTTLYGEGPRQLRFTIHIDNQYDKPVWVNVMEEKIGFKVCVPGHAELTPEGNRASEAVVETSRTMNLRKVQVFTAEMTSPVEVDLMAVFNAKDNDDIFSDKNPVLGMDSVNTALPLDKNKKNAKILSDIPYLNVTVIKSDINDMDAPSGATPILGYEYNFIFEPKTAQEVADDKGSGLLSEK